MEAGEDSSEWQASGSGSGSAAPGAQQSSTKRLLVSGSGKDKYRKLFVKLDTDHAGALEKELCEQGVAEAVRSVVCVCVRVCGGGGMAQGWYE